MKKINIKTLVIVAVMLTHSGQINSASYAAYRPESFPQKVRRTSQRFVAFINAHRIAVTIGSLASVAALITLGIVGKKLYENQNAQKALQTPSNQPFNAPTSIEPDATETVTPIKHDIVTPEAASCLQNNNDTRIFVRADFDPSLWSAHKNLDLGNYLFGQPEMVLAPILKKDEVIGKNHPPDVRRRALQKHLSRIVPLMEQGYAERFPGRHLWQDINVTPAEEKAIKALSRGESTGFDFLKGALKIYTKDELLDALTKYPEVTGEGKKPIILVGASLQQLMRDKPKLLDGAAAQAANTDARFDGSAKGYPVGDNSEKANPRARCGYACITRHQPSAVQGETKSTKNCAATMVDKYVIEPILTALYPEQFRRGIFLGDYNNPNDTKVAYRSPAIMHFQARPADSKIDDRDPRYHAIPALAPTDLTKAPKVAQICSFADNLRHFYEDIEKTKRILTPEDKQRIAAAETLLTDQMTGAVKAAIVNGHKKIFLTPLGGGAFRNSFESIARAMREANKVAQKHDIQIYIIDYEPYRGDDARYKKDGNLTDTDIKTARTNGMPKKWFTREGSLLNLLQQEIPGCEVKWCAN